MKPRRVETTVNPELNRRARNWDGALSHCETKALEHNIAEGGRAN